MTLHSSYSYNILPGEAYTANGLSCRPQKIVPSMTRVTSHKTLHQCYDSVSKHVSIRILLVLASLKPPVTVRCTKGRPCTHPGIELKSFLLTKYWKSSADHTHQDQPKNDGRHRQDAQRLPSMASLSFLPSA